MNLVSCKFSAMGDDVEYILDFWLPCVVEWLALD